jgi:glycosyltransferase involved in cell wall biosynthesis
MSNGGFELKALAEPSSRSGEGIAAMQRLPHIAVCICTYRRPELLQRLLEGLAAQDTDGQFTFSVVLVDNDQARSAEATVNTFRHHSPLEIKYCVEQRQSISHARNMAVQASEGDFVAFIDDDEFPTPQWLLTLFTTCRNRQVDGVLGPVKPHFDVEPPRWVVAGKFYDRPSYPTGLVIDGKKGRTGNVLLRKAVFAAKDAVFRPEFRTGEDQDFFGRMIEKGHVFIWCHEALAYEVVPPIRWNRAFILKRALLRGATSRLQRGFGARDICTSLIAVPAYVTVLPLSLLLGEGRFMTYLVSLCDHVGRLLAVAGINPVRTPYVTE